MPRKISLILCLAVAALGIACSDSPAPAPDTREADIQAVKQVEASWAKDAASKDPDKWASYFTDDASGLYPGAPILNGKSALRAALAAYFADPNFSLSFQSNRAMAAKSGDMVYTQGAYAMTMTDPKTKKPVSDKGKYLTVFTKQSDGSWKAVADIFNSDSAM